MLPIPDGRPGNAPGGDQGVPLVIEKRGHETSKAIFALANTLHNGAARTANAKGGAQPAEKKQPERTGLFGRLIARR
nr:MAG: hypothetical protein DIU80_03215 [Chloroflexota bacterium]